MKFELPHDDSRLNTGSNADPSISAEQLEVKNKRLRLYQKAILAKDFETADTLDTSMVPEEELKEVRTRTLTSLVEEIEKYNKDHYTSLSSIEQQFAKIQQGLHLDTEDVNKPKEAVVNNYFTKCVDRMFSGRGQFSNFGNSPTYFEEIKEWGGKVGFTERDIKKIISDGYLRLQKNTHSSLSGRYDSAARERHFNSNPEAEKKKIQQYEDEKLPQEIEQNLEKVLKTSELAYSEKEIQNLKEEGFLAFLEVGGMYAYSDKEAIKRALKISSLSEDTIHSKHIENIAVNKVGEFAKEISFKKEDKNDIYSVEKNLKLFGNIGYVAKSELFPQDLKDYPEIQQIIDDKFKEFVEQVKIDKGEFVASGYLLSEANRYSPSPEVEVKAKEVYRYIENLAEFAKSTKVSASVLTATNFKQLAEKYIESYFADPKLDLQYTFKLGKEELEKVGITYEELNNKAEESFLNILKANDPASIEKISNINKCFNLSEKFKKSGAVITAEVAFLENLIHKTDTRATAAFLKEIDLPQSALDSEYFIELKQVIINKALSGGLGLTHDIQIISKKLNFSNCEEFLKSEEVQYKISEVFNEDVKKIISDMVGSMFGYNIECLSLKDGILVHDPKGKDKGRDGYKYRADEKAYKFINAYNFAASLENKELIRGLFIEEIKSQAIEHKRISNMNNVFKGADRYGIFDITKEDVKNVIVDSLIDLMGVGSYSVMEKSGYGHDDREVSRDYLFVPTVSLIERFSKGFELNKDQTRRLALKSVEYLLTDEKNLKPDEAKNIFEKYRITEPEVHDAVNNLYLAYISKGSHWTENALKIKKDFSLEVDSSEMDKKMQSAFILKLKKEEPSDLYWIYKQIESLPNEFLKSEEVQTHGRKLFLKLLSSGGGDEARKIKTALRLDVTVENVISENPVAKKFIETIQGKFPSLAKKYLSSIDAFISIYSQIGDERMVSTLEAHPFLAEALTNNEQYGLKLLFKFDSLDKLSKANIQTIYEARKNILEKRPDIDINSRDFRIAMQNSLESYRSNEKILGTLADAGINVEEWLNHEDETYFELGRDKTLKFSDTITTPIERTKETIEKYCATVREVLTGYKDELSSAEVPLKDLGKLNEDLENLRSQKNKAVEAGDTKKADGIERGIKNLESQIANPKTVFVWNKMIGDISLIDTVKKDVFKAYDSLKATESEMSEKERDNVTPVGQKRKELLKLKSKIEACKKSIQEKFHLLGARLTEFNHDFYLNISPALGEERAKSLEQEKNELVGEFMDHYTTDHNTLRDIFTEKEDNTLDGQPMRIAIWDRNPDIDLYLGNYTDCCIRIDSDHMGEECTIADYFTDMGMQIVNVYDEKKGIPIATAWCWIGHDDDDNVAFVVDNIEANTSYSSTYKSQLEQKLKAYIEDYAKKVGAKLVQGSKNNDLIVGRMDSSYFKLGGYNRASGYYLEGEDEHNFTDDEVHDDEVEN